MEPTQLPTKPKRIRKTNTGDYNSQLAKSDCDARFSASSYAILRCGHRRRTDVVVRIRSGTRSTCAAPTPWSFDARPPAWQENVHLTFGRKIASHHPRRLLRLMQFRFRRHVFMLWLSDCCLVNWIFAEVVRSGLLWFGGALLRFYNTHRKRAKGACWHFVYQPNCTRSWWNFVRKRVISWKKMVIYIRLFIFLKQKIQKWRKLILVLCVIFINCNALI